MRTFAIGAYIVAWVLDRFVGCVVNDRGMPGSVFAFHVPRVCRVRGNELTEQDLITRDIGAFRPSDKQGVLHDLVTAARQPEGLLGS